MTKKTKQTVVRATTIVMAITVLSKLLGFGREASLAAVFGATKVTDAYLVAMVIPTLLFGIVASAITTVGIPVLSEYLHNEEKRKEFGSLAWSCFHAVLVFLLLLCLLAWPFAPQLVKFLAPGFDPEQAFLTVALVRILLPAVVFMGLAGWAKAVLNTHHHFTIPAAIGLPYNLVLIGGIFLSGLYWGIKGVAWASLLAIASQFFIQLPALKRYGLSYKAVFSLRHPGLKKMGVLLLPVLLGAGANEINIVVDRILASGLTEGSISALNYAQRVLALPQGLFTLPLVTVLYPALAECCAVGNITELKEKIRRGLEALAVIIVPISVGLIVLRTEMTSFLFERGAFESSDTAMTAVALFFYGLGLLFLVWRDYLNKAFYALQDTLTPMWTGVGLVLVNIGLNLILVRYLAHGGLALASSLAALVGCLSLLFLLQRRLGHIGGRQIVQEMGKITAAALIMGIVVVWANNMLFSCSGLGLWEEFIMAGGLKGFLLQGLRLVLLIGFGGLFYAGLCRLFGVREMAYALSLLTKFRKRLG